MNLHLLLDRLQRSRSGLNSRVNRRRCRNGAAGQAVDRLLRVEQFEPRILLASDLSDNRIDNVLEQITAQEVTDGLFTLFDGVVDSLQQTFDQVSTLPLIGDQIQQGVEPFFQTIDQIGDRLEKTIGEAYVTVGLDPSESLVQLYETGLFEIFGPSGLNILQDGGDLGNTIEISDIVRTSGSDESGGVEEPGTEWVQWDIHVGQNTSLTLPFEFGLDFADLDSTLFENFGFNIDAGEGIQFDLFWDFRLGFGATLRNDDSSVVDPVFFINSGASTLLGDDVEELRAGVEVFSAGDPGITADVALGLVNGSVQDGTVARTTISAGDEIIPATRVADMLAYSADFTLTIDDATSSTDFNIVLPEANEDFASFLLRLNAELISTIGGAYTTGIPAILATPDFSGINGLFSSEGVGGPSLIFTATTPDIEALAIEFANPADDSFPSSTLGFGQKQFEDGRSQAIGFSGDESMVGNELVAETDAPADGSLAEDVDFTLLIGATEVPIILRTTATEDVESLDDLQEMLSEALANSLSQSGLDPADVDILVEGEKFKFVANAGQTLAVESDGLETTTLSLIFTVDATNEDFDPDSIDSDDQSTFNRLTLQQMQEAADMGNLTDLLPPVLAAEGEIRLHVDANAQALSNFVAQGLGVAGDALGLPELAFDLKIDASSTASYSQTEGIEVEHEFGSVQFDNITIDVGSLLENILEPFAAVIESTIGPLLSIVGPATGEAAGFLNAPIPLLDQISGLLGISPPSILDLSGNSDDLNRFLDAVQAIAGFSDEIVETIALLASDGRPITIGCLQYEPGEGGAAGTLANCEFAAVFDSIDLEDFLGLEEFDWDPGGFSVDILSPGSIINMILGESFDIVSYSLPTADIQLGSTFGFDWRILGFDIDATATLNLGGDTGFGFFYDSTGLESIIQSARVGEIPDYGDLLDGFYIQTDPDDPELKLEINAGGSGGVDVKVLSASASARLDGDVFLDVVDPDNGGDGQIRLDEIFTLTDDFNRPEKLINLFDAGASLSGSFSLGGSIGISPFDVSIDAGDLGLPTSISVNLQLSDIIGAFTDVPLDSTPVLATPVYQNGRRLLRINSGPHANARMFGDTTDGAESFTVTGSNGAIQVSFNGVNVTYGGAYQGIIAAGGDGNDTLNFSGVTDLPVEIRGGDGDDNLTGGSRSDAIFGGAGDDAISGGGGNDLLVGDEGNDNISGGAGEDRLRGGRGADILDGEGGNDDLDGGSGDDDVSGGVGSDVLRGQLGDDTLRGEDGNDILEGGFGADMLLGGPGNDTLRGGRGIDILEGDGGNDTLQGGAGGDTLQGGAGDDLLQGESGNDILRGGAGNDELRGEGGSDDLDGGAGDDTLFGNESNDTLRGGLDADVLYGNIGDDLLIADVDDLWVQGHEGFDIFRVDQRGALSTFEGDLTNNTIARLTNTTVYASVETIEFFLSNLGGDELRIRGSALPLQVTGGDNDDIITVQDVLASATIDAAGGDDEITVRKAQAPVAINGGAGAADEFILDLTLDFNGLVGSLVDNGFTGLGFTVPVTYQDDVEKASYILGAGVDLLDIDYTASGVTTEVNAGDGDDRVTINSILGLTTINGDADDDAVVAPLAGDPNLLDDTTYANLTLNVESLEVIHSGNEQVDWRVEDGAVRVSTVPCEPGDDVGCGILNTIGAERVLIDAGSNPANTITVANNAATRQTLTIGDNAVDVEIGSEVLKFTAQDPGNFVTQEGHASSVLITPDGNNVYVLRSEPGAVDGTIEVYQRNPVSGDLVFLEELNTGTQGELLGATALAFVPDQAGNGRLIVGGPGVDALFAFDRDGSTGDLTFAPSVLNPLFGITGTDSIKVSGHGDRLYVSADLTSASVGGFTTLSSDFASSFDQELLGVGAEAGFRVRSIEVDTVPAIEMSTVLDPSGTTATTTQFNGPADLSSVDDFYTGKFLRFTTGGGSEELVGVRRQIADYDGTTRRFTLDEAVPEFAPLDGEVFFIEEETIEYVFVSQSETTPTAGDKVEVYGVIPDRDRGAPNYSPVGEVTLSGSAGELALSPDSSRLYVASPAEDSITKLDWDRATETLSDANATIVTNGVGNVEGLEGLASIAVSGDFLFAVGTTGDSVAAFARAGNGDLSFLQVIRDKGERAGGLADPNRVTTSPDGAFVYVSSSGDDGMGPRRNPGGVAWLPVDAMTSPDVLQFDFPDQGDFLNEPGQAFSTAVSPDGLSTYTVRRDGGEIEVYQRDAPTGDLLFEQTVSHSQAESLAVSPDGDHVYVLGSGANDVSSYERDAVTGQLSSELPLGEPSLFHSAGDIRISSSGDQVFITGSEASETNASVTFVFDRDQSTGALTHSTTLDAVFGVFLGSNVPADLAHVVVGIDVASDGEFLVTSHATPEPAEIEGEKVVLWQRTVGGGGAITYAMLDSQLLDAPGAVAISPDGDHAFVASPSGTSITVYAIDRVAGTLTELQTVRNNVDGVRGLDGVSALEASENLVYAIGTTDDSAVVFRRGDDGTIAFEQQLVDQAAGVEGLQNGNSLALTPDRQFLYIGSTGEGATDGGIAWFRVDEDAEPVKTIVEHRDIISLDVATAAGSDLVRLGDASTLQSGVPVLIPVAIDAQGGPDRVDIRTQAANQVATIELGAGGDTLDLRSNGDGSSVTINGGDGEDRINVWSTGTNNVTQINTDAGDDTIRVAGKKIGSDVHIHGGIPVLPEMPGDTLLFDPANPDPLTPNTDPAPPLVEGTGTVKVIGAQFNTVHYESIESPRIINPPIPTTIDPLAIFEGEDFDALNPLQVSAVIPFSGTATFSWDINGDGEFGDIPSQVGPNSTVLGFEITWEELVALGIDDDGTYVVTTRVTDLNDDFSEETITLTINNQAPSVSIGSDGTVDVNEPFQLQLNSSDPGRDSIDGWTIDWGDGSAPETFLGNPGMVTHSYAATGNYTIHVDQVADEDGVYNDPAPTDVTATVTEVVPIVTTIAGPDSIDEGSTYTLSLSALQGASPAALVSWTVNWGDGAVETIAGNPSSIDHVYDGPATFVISATTLDADGLVTLAENEVTVDVAGVDQVLTLSTAGPTTIDEGTDFTLDLASFDPGDDALSGWTIDWGDGAVEAVAGDPASLTHTYDDGPNFYAISATAQDEDGSYASNTLNVTVDNVAPTLTISGAATTDEGSEYTLTLASSDPGDDAISSWEIDWGDGSPPEVVVGGTQQATHIYADGPDTHTITASAADEDGTFNAAAISVDVNDLPPAPVISGQSFLFEGSEYTLFLSNIDPGNDVVNGWSIDWGDGTGIETIVGNPESVTHTYIDGGPTIFETNFLHSSSTAAATVDNDTIQSSIVVSGVSGLLRDVDVTLNVTHPSLADLEIFLVGPAGTRIALVNEGIATGSDLANTVFDDLALDAFGDGAAPYSDTFRPADPLAQLANVDPNGTWILEISDRGSAMVGSLDSWSLSINEGVSLSTTVPTITADLLDETDTPHAALPLSVEVFNLAPEVQLAGPTIIPFGDVFDLTVGNVDDPGDDTVTEYHVLWGDDTAAELFGGPGTITHAYATPGRYSVAIVLVDEDGNHSAAGVHQVDVGLVADFDSDLVISGGDFLLWQRGFGTPAPNATKGDGDADLDLDVDGVDLEIWERQYGNVVLSSPLSAAAKDAPALSAVRSTEPLSSATADPTRASRDRDGDDLSTRTLLVDSGLRSATSSSAARDRTLLNITDLVGIALTESRRTQAFVNSSNELAMEEDSLQSIQAAALLEFTDTTPIEDNTQFMWRSVNRSNPEADPEQDLITLTVLDKAFEHMYG